MSRSNGGSVVIVNPNAGSIRSVEAFCAEVERVLGVGCLHTKSSGHARQLARERSEAGAERIYVAGGDGTVNEVVNGVLATDARPTVGIIPAGTGNDLARLAGGAETWLEALISLPEARPRPFDVVRVSDEEHEHYVINAATGGFSAKVSDQMNSDMKESLGSLAYILSAASALPQLETYDVVLEVDGDVIREEVVSVIAANGRWVAGGQEIAPRADAGDGALDLVVIPAAGMVEMVGMGSSIAAGLAQENELIVNRRARLVRLESSPAMPFVADGELLEMSPTTFELIPGALQVLCH